MKVSGKINGSDSNVRWVENLVKQITFAQADRLASEDDGDLFNIKQKEVIKEFEIMEALSIAN